MLAWATYWESDRVNETSFERTKFDFNRLNELYDCCDELSIYSMIVIWSVTILMQLIVALTCNLLNRYNISFKAGGNHSCPSKTASFFQYSEIILVCVSFISTIITITLYIKFQQSFHIYKDKTLSNCSHCIDRLIYHFDSLMCHTIPHHII